MSTLGNDLKALSALGTTFSHVDDGIVVEVPDPHLQHSTISVHAYRIDNEWHLSDGGLTAFTADVALAPLARHAICANLNVKIDDDGTVSTVLHPEAPLAASVLRFAATVAALPIAARVLACATTTKPSRVDSAADKLAQSTRSHLRQQFPALANRNAIRLRPEAPRGSKTVHVRPRLAVFRTGSPLAPPDVVCEFMDMSAGSPTRAFQAVASTMVAYDYVAKRFVVARGTRSELDDVAELVGRVSAAVVPADDLTELDAAVGALV